MSQATAAHHPKVRRLEDKPLVSGEGQYVDDLKFSRPPLHMSVVRSVYAHARITKIDTSAASAMPGVVGVYTAADFVGKFAPFSWFPAQNIRPASRYPLAVDKVRFVGDPIAVVLAEDKYTARDALDLVEIEYEPLPVSPNLEAGLADNASLLYEENGTNIGYNTRTKAGDIEAAFAQAAHIIPVKLNNQRLAPVSLEARALVADYNPEQDLLTVWMSSQGVYRIREQVCEVLRLPLEKVRVIAPDCGGAFGIKGRLISEESLVCQLALELKRPVKWVEGRSENLVGAPQGRGQLHELELAVDADGRLLGLRGRILADLGAFLIGINTFMAARSAMMLPGVYNLPAIDIEVVGVLTNKVPIFSYRGAGRPEPAYSIERLIEAAAHKLGLDPAEMRRRNFIPPDVFPYKTLTNLVYDSGNYPVMLEKALAAADYTGWRKKQVEQPERCLGIGIGAFVEVAAGPVTVATPGLPPGENMQAHLSPEGKIELISGVTTNGQSHMTSQAFIVAGQFGLKSEDITVRMGDTNLPVYGVGTFGSRNTALAGSAALLTSQSLREKIIAAAADLLEAAPVDLEIVDGGVQIKGLPTRRLSFEEIGAATGGLSATGNFNPDGATYPSGAHIAVVEIDRETGDIKILKYVAVDDAGKILMPTLAEGQVAGSLAQGIAQALYEEVVYDENGQLITGTLMDYALPTADMLPNYESYFQETPSPLNPLGAKGIGESGCIGGPPAVVNAVLDALRHQGVAADELNLDMPLRPEKIWKAFR